MLGRSEPALGCPVASVRWFAWWFHEVCFLPLCCVNLEFAVCAPSGLMGSVFLIFFASSLEIYALSGVGVGWLVLLGWYWFEFFWCCMVDAGHFVGLGWVRVPWVF